MAIQLELNLQLKFHPRYPIDDRIWNYWGSRTFINENTNESYDADFYIHNNRREIRRVQSADYTRSPYERTVNIDRRGQYIRNLRLILDEIAEDLGLEDRWRDYPLAILG